MNTFFKLGIYDSSRVKPVTQSCTVASHIVDPNHMQNIFNFNNVERPMDIFFNFFHNIISSDLTQYSAGY